MFFSEFEKMIETEKEKESVKMINFNLQRTPLKILITLLSLKSIYS